MFVPWFESCFVGHGECVVSFTGQEKHPDTSVSIVGSES